MKNKIIALLVISFLSLLIFILISKLGLYNEKKFGLEYNKERLKENIPELKENWVINNENALFEYYNPNINRNGHLKKYINLSKSNIGSERDVFKIDSIIFYSLYERNSKNKVIYKLLKNEGLSKIFQFEKEIISSKAANTLLEKTNESIRFNSSWDIPPLRKE